MIINKLNINNLRNHADSSLTFCKDINIFFGDNGAGKTSILESIALASYSKSFLPVSDQTLIKSGESFFSIHLNAKNDIGIDYKLNLLYQSGKRKNIKNSFGDNLNPKDIIGILPVVVLSPDFKSITFGTPQDRRQFIDGILSQSKKIYIEHLLDLKKCLKQRNSILHSALKTGQIDENLLDIWTASFIKNAVELIVRRAAFIEEFQHFFQKTYEEVSGDKEKVRLEYIPDSLTQTEANLKDRNEISKKLFERYDYLKNIEKRRGSTLFGPQKDELNIYLNDGLAKEIASQGQHKSLLISLKFSEYEYLKYVRQENPVILLDDIFSELDDKRIEQTLEIISHKNAQTFITITNIDLLKKLIPDNLNKQIYNVENGKISEYNL